MLKRGLLVFLVLILSLSFVSAGWLNELFTGSLADLAGKTVAVGIYYKSVPEWNQLYLDCGIGKKIQIRTVDYCSTRDPNKCNMCPGLNEKCNNKRSCVFWPTNENCNGVPFDPHQWVTKNLRVTYDCVDDATYTPPPEPSTPNYCLGGVPSENVVKGPSTYTSGYTPTSWTYSNDADTSTPCKWKCASGYSRYGNICQSTSSIACGSSYLAPTTTVGTIKGPSTYPGGYSSTYPSGYPTTLWTYSNDADTSTPCKWKCDTGYHYKSFGLNNLGCEANFCVGTTPANSNLCSGDDQGLTANTLKTLVSSCTSTVKCEYTCNSGYHKDGNSCVQDGTQPSPAPSPQPSPQPTLQPGTNTRFGYENNYLSIDCSTGKKIQIKTVRYGKGNRNNQCPKVNTDCNNKQSCSLVISNNNCGGDPYYGISKDWTVTYDCVSSGVTSQPVPSPTPQPSQPGEGPTVQQIQDCLSRATSTEKIACILALIL